jgi:chromosome segregation ATPase
MLDPPSPIPTSYQARAEKREAEKRAIRAETDADVARAAAAEAKAAADRALERAREERADLSARLQATEEALESTSSKLGMTEENVVSLEESNAALQHAADVADSNAAKTALMRDAALKRGGELERILAAKAAEAEELRAAAVAAEAKEAATAARARSLEDSLADAHARIGALESSEAAAGKSLGDVTRDFGDLAQRKAEADAEIATLKDELSRRPPIDIIRELDVSNLLQRNMQAAAAMEQLLKWQKEHAPQPLAASLAAPHAQA